MSSGRITLKQNREKPVRNQHPWIFSGAIAQAEQAEPGEIVSVYSSKGDFLGRGYWNPKSQIQVRLLTWADEPIEDTWWQTMLQRAIDGRTLKNIRHEDGEPLAYRLINAENDYLPGLIVDRYDQWLVLQALTLGIEQRKQMIAEQLAAMLKPRGIYERSDVDVRKREGLEQRSGILWGEAPPEYITIEDIPQIYVDIANGHKTGLYLDQSVNHRILYDLISNELDGTRRLLNLFSYTGGFALSALCAGGVNSVSVDSSAEMLALAEKNIQLNALPPEHSQHIQADAFDYLHYCAENDELFDIVVVDPPKFAHNKQQIDKASRGYKDLNLNAFKIIKPGGYLMTFSCSGAVDADLFQKIVFGALADSGRQAQIIQHLHAASDHPVALTFPEGAYLKGLLLRVF